MFVLFFFFSKPSPDRIFIVCVTKGHSSCVSSAEAGCGFPSLHASFSRNGRPLKNSGGAKITRSALENGLMYPVMAVIRHLSNLVPLI